MVAEVPRHLVPKAPQLTSSQPMARPWLAPSLVTFSTKTPVTNTVRAPNLASFDFTRGNGNALNGRTISAAVFAVSDIDLEAGFSSTDLVSINFTQSGLDIQDVGIATTATVNTVPEPSSVALLALGSLFMLRRKR